MAPQTLPVGNTAPRLTDFATTHMDQLFDVIALLSVIEDRTSEMNLPADAPMEEKEAACNTMRLAQMARYKVRATIEAMDQLFSKSAA